MCDFWAKSGQDDEWLPLDRHLDDVAAVAERLWDVALTPRQRAWVAAACRVDEATMRAWWIFLAGIHDAGKASAAFQGLVPDLAARVVAPDLPTGSIVGKAIRHDQVSGAILVHAWGNAWAPNVVSMTWQSLAAVISGHHGVLRSKRELSDASFRALEPFPAWAPYQRALLDVRAERLGLRPDRVPTPTSSAVVLALAGLMTVSDWIGSDQERFPVTATPVRAESTSLAVGAVTPGAWAAPRVTPGHEFGDLFVVVGRDAGAPSVPCTPRASQRAVIDALDGRSDPCLVLVEDRTGSGKTEAALWAAYRGLENGARGVYIGMPTRATANQLHQRAERFLARALDDDTARARLLHSGIEAADPAVGETPAPSAVAVPGDDAETAVREETDARAWFLDRRRGLLERFGVGTIDQALLAVLTTRHFAVRLWGLQGKVVIADEVHAYDAYMSALLDRAVEWLAALDCPIVLLSATLPPSRRAELVTAYRRGRLAARERKRGRRLRLDAVTFEDAPYPRLTVADADGVEVIAVDDPREPRTFAVDRLDVPEQDDGALVADRVAEAVADGGCVAVVCNTVALAQRRFAAIRRRVDADTEVLLLHAKLRPAEREPLEQRLMTMLGPATRIGAGRPERLVVVATQVIEQSLDVDFDLMWSDVAPIDLLIQRAGRIHRHERRDEHGATERPAAHRVPRLIVLDTVGRSIARPYVRGNDRVYAPPVLHRTRHLLRGCQEITEPNDLDRMIGAVYPAKPGNEALGLPAEDAAALALADEQLRSETRKRDDEAQRNLIADPGAADPPWEQAETPLADAEDPGATVRNAAATRWITEPTVGVVVLGEAELQRIENAPSDADARELLRRAVSLRVHQLGIRLDRRRREPGLGLDWQPAAWQRHPLLRHHLLVRTDEQGQALPPDGVPGCPALPLHWTPIDGVMIQRRNEERACAST